MRLKNEISWNTDDKVKYIFCITVPKENRDNEHLQILSLIARNMLDDSFRNLLFYSNGEVEIYEKIVNIAQVDES